MQKSKIFDFDLEIFNARLHILHNTTEEELQAYINEHFKDAIYERPRNNSATAIVFEHETCGEEYAIDFTIPLKRNDPDSQKTISHEAFHIVCEVFNSRDIKYNYDNQETFAYTLGYIVRKINEEVFA